VQRAAAERGASPDHAEDTSSADQVEGDAPSAVQAEGDSQEGPGPEGPRLQGAVSVAPSVAP